MPQPRYTLRTLLIAIAIGGVMFAAFSYVHLPPYEARLMRQGRDRGEVVEKLGKASRSVKTHYSEAWYYELPWGSLMLRFSARTEKCDQIAYKRSGERNYWKFME